MATPDGTLPKSFTFIHAWGKEPVGSVWQGEAKLERWLGELSIKLVIVQHYALWCLVKLLQSQLRVNQKPVVYQKSFLLCLFR